MGSTEKLPLSSEQMDILLKIQNSNFKLSATEKFVINEVCTKKEYHANQQYHLTNIRNRYIKTQK